MEWPQYLWFRVLFVFAQKTDELLHHFLDLIGCWFSMCLNIL